MYGVILFAAMTTAQSAPELGWKGGSGCSGWRLLRSLYRVQRLFRVLRLLGSGWRGLPRTPRVLRLLRLLRLRRLAGRPRFAGPGLRVPRRRNPPRACGRAGGPGDFSPAPGGRRSGRQAPRSAAPREGPGRDDGGTAGTGEGRRQPPGRRAAVRGRRAGRRRGGGRNVPDAGTREGTRATSTRCGPRWSSTARSSRRRDASPSGPATSSAPTSRAWARGRKPPRGPAERGAGTETRGPGGPICPAPLIVDPDRRTPSPATTLARLPFADSRSNSAAISADPGCCRSVTAGIA